jgi:hypothetical protein
MNKLIGITMLLIGLLAKRLDKEKVAYAISCGSSKPVKSADGFTYEAVSLLGPETDARHRDRQLVGNGIQVRP